jgi:hypothetical protein
MTVAEVIAPRATIVASWSLERVSSVPNQRIPRTQMREKAAESSDLDGLALQSEETASKIGRASRVAVSFPRGNVRVLRRAETTIKRPTVILSAASTVASLGTRKGLTAPLRTTIWARKKPVAAIRNGHFDSVGGGVFFFATRES